MTTETTKKSKPAGAGGKKGQAIIDWFAANGPATRKAAAEAVGATVQRVGEVIRAHGGFEKVDGGYILLDESHSDPEPHRELEDLEEFESEPAESDAECYRRVMALLDAGETAGWDEEDIERARAYAKRTKRRAPRLPA